MKVVIYSKDPCPYCVRAKNFFKSRGVPFEEIDLTGQQDKMDELKARTGHMTMPQIFIDEKLVGGYTDLMDKVNNGELNFD